MADQTTLPAMVVAMQDPGFYQHRPAEVTLVQTHISYVFLAGDEVYKIKKPVRFSFLDFSTAERRQHFCHEEIRLNRRLAPHIYLGVLGICRDGGRYTLRSEDDPRVVDYAVHMRRLDAQRILANLLAIGSVTERTIEAVAIRMLEFHRHADHGAEVRANGDPQAIWRILSDNFAGARPFRDVTIPARDDDAIQAYCTAFLDREAGLLRQRQRDDRIRDCHGDLHAEHIYIDDPILAFDCVEFNPQFRYCDVASEMAFLAMDLDYRGHPALSRHVIATYAAHANDPELPRLARFYQCYRAYVRGKVDSLKSAEPEVGGRERATAQESARRHFALAYRYTWNDRPRIIVVFGLSGSGKSTVAAALRDRTGFLHLNSDVIRKELAGLSPQTRGDDELYRPAHSARTYATMRERAAVAVRAGRGVIIDATFQRCAHRDEVRALADAERVPVLFVECRTPVEVIRQRLERRTQSGDDPSDADWSIYLKQCEGFESWGSGEGGNHLAVDTTVALSAVTAAIEERLRRLA